MALTNPKKKKAPKAKPLCSVPGCKNNRWARTGALKMCSTHFREHNQREAAREAQGSGHPQPTPPPPQKQEQEFAADAAEILADRPAALALVHRIAKYMGVQDVPCRVVGEYVEVLVGAPQHPYLIEKMEHGPDMFGSIVSKGERFAVREPWQSKTGAWIVGRITVGREVRQINPWKGAACPT